MVQLASSHDAFDELSGDVVVVPGFAGSRLVDTQRNNEEYWLTEDLLEDRVHPPMHLPIHVRDDAPDPVVSQGLLTDRPYIEYYSHFIHTLQQTADTSQGRLRVHLFDYDFRRNTVTLASRFIDYIETINRQQQQPVFVIAHSMGGLIALAALHQRPVLFRGILFAGTPFHGCIDALKNLQKGALWGRNRDVFTAETQFQLQSTFTFLPLDGRGLQHRENGTEWLLDFQDIDGKLEVDYAGAITEPGDGLCVNALLY
ncbi:Alpha/Beta hydrolase protein [Syncephalis pseudoplumigaleata]|uniref:Alpha/Beta hydrolase protein n=1 Tax=Syncephalis pseudoplumigaleata TaxID=1712513 RepID=A0A4P9Z7R7_9FUNG|nr:Alpha/Beta hydrolase protein [Syncephalis pseudoplumigaleata]|eukprot:RKP27770.1 Alpha/Beta hydrolase protein [Syncephalis pseudoplumigaleata]